MNDEVETELEEWERVKAWLNSRPNTKWKICANTVIEHRYVPSATSHPKLCSNCAAMRRFA